MVPTKQAESGKLPSTFTPFRRQFTSDYLRLPPITSDYLRGQFYGQVDCGLPVCGVKDEGELAIRSIFK